MFNKKNNCLCLVEPLVALNANFETFVINAFKSTFTSGKFGNNLLLAAVSQFKPLYDKGITIIIYVYIACVVV